MLVDLVGDAGLYAVAAAAGMSDFSVSGFWLTAMLSPADQARFFFEICTGRFPRSSSATPASCSRRSSPPEYLGRAARGQAAGLPGVLQGRIRAHRPWPARAPGRHRLEGHGHRFAMAVMTDGDPTMQYGIDTINGVAGALLR